MKNSPQPVRLACFNPACSADPAANRKKTLALAEPAARQKSADHLHPGTFSLAVFLPVRRASHFELAEPIPGPTTLAFQRLARKRSVVIIVSLFERARPGPLPQQRRHHRRRRLAPGDLPQDAHPG